MPSITLSNTRWHGKRPPASRRISALKDELDDLTMELPFPENPLQALMNVLRRRERTAWEISAFLQKAERHGRQTADLEMLIGVREYRKRQALLAQTSSTIRAGT